MSDGRKRSIPYTGIVILLLVGGLFTWAVSRSVAQEEETSKRSAVLAQAIEGEVDQEVARHEASIARLKGLKKKLQDADAPQEQIDAVDDLIEQENAQHEERRKTLQRLARARVDDDEVWKDLDLPEEYHDLAEAVGKLNQSYHIPPVVSHGAMTGGSSYVDVDDDIEEGETDEERIERIKERIKELQEKLDGLQDDE